MPFVPKWVFDGLFCLLSAGFHNIFSVFYTISKKKEELVLMEREVRFN